MTGHRRQEVAEAVSPRPVLGETDPAPDDREDREDHERDGHHRRRFVHVVRDFVIGAKLAEERQEQQPEPVEGGQRRRDRGGEPQPRMAARPRVGKTTLAMTIAENFALNGKPVAFFSQEMSELNLGEILPVN